MRWSEDRILTTHTGSLPRPPELTRLYVRRARGGEVDPAELDRLGKEALRQIVEKQADAGIDIGNNGEQQREAFFLYVRHRMSGFGSGWKRWPRGDVERYPLLKQQMAEQLATREAVSNMDPPKAVGEVRYIDDSELKSEIADFRAVLDRKPNAFVEPFLTAPSPGIIAAAMKNEYYDSDEAYLAALGQALRIEYEAIVKAGFLLQLDCPDLALERHLSYQDRPLAEDQSIVAGVIDDLTGFVEHPEVVADRIENVARVVGDPKRVMAGTDCGFDTSAGMGRVTEDVVWAKFKAMAEGAKIASQRLGLH